MDYGLQTEDIVMSDNKSLFVCFGFKGVLGIINHKNTEYTNRMTEMFEKKCSMEKFKIFRGRPQAV